MVNGGVWGEKETKAAETETETETETCYLGSSDYLYHAHYR